MVLKKNTTDVIQIIPFLLTLQSKCTTGKLNTIQSTENFHKQLNALKQTPLNLCQQLIKAARYYGYPLLFKRTVALPLHTNYWLKIKLGNG